MKKYIIIITLFLLWGCKKEDAIDTNIPAAPNISPVPNVATFPIISFTGQEFQTSILASQLVKLGILNIDKTTSSIDKIKISVEGVNENITEDVFVSKNANLENEINFSGNARTNISTVSYYDKKIDTISLEAGVNTFYLYVKIKNQVALSENGKAISFNLTALTDVKSGNKIALDKNIAVNAGKINIPLYATIDVVKSYSSSDKAVDKFVVGKSVAEGFNLSVTKAGTAKVEVVGLKTDGGVPISDFWITNSVDEDFGVRVSNFNSNNNVIKGKTAVTNKSFTIDLVVGVNNVVFKTTNLYKAIASGTKVGLKITLGSGVTYTSLYEAKSDSVDLADKIVVSNRWLGGASYLPNTEYKDDPWGSYNIYPIDASRNFVNNFPKIMSMGLSTKFYADNYPNLDFTNARGLNGQNFFSYAYTPNTIKVNILNNFIFNTNNNFLKLYDNGFQLTLHNPSNNYINLAVFVNVFNNSDKIWGPKAVGFDPYKGGWKFYGNPEMEIWVSDDGTGYGSVNDLLKGAHQIY